MGKLLCSVFIFLFLTPNFSFAEEKNSYFSKYTPLDHCKLIVRGDGGDTQKCPGNEGYQVFFEGDNYHNGILLKKHGKEYRLYPFGTARVSSVYGTPLEWYYKKEGGKSKLIGLIYRVVVNGDDDKVIQLLDVFRVLENDICPLAIIDSNEEAHKALQGNKVCLKD